MLDQAELLRYQRHFPVIGLDGQIKLKHAKVLCVGAGGLGCPALQYLAAAGIGYLGIMDADTIELHNLQRQILFQQNDVGRNKADVIRERLTALNEHVTIHVYQEFLTEQNAHQSIAAYDVVLDATDNYQSRYLLNKICRLLNKPLISASIYQFDAQVSVFNYQNGPCYQCLYPEPPPSELVPNCAVGGVLGVLPGTVGTIQATEAIKVILGIGTVLSGTLLCIDLLHMRFSQFDIEKQNCAHHPLVGFNKQQPKLVRKYHNINASQLSDLLSNDSDAIKLIDVRESYERDICHIGGQHIPLGSVEDSLQQLDKNESIIVYCKSGGRSGKACGLLIDAGFTKVSNLEGGILSWIETVDSSLSRY